MPATVSAALKMFFNDAKYPIIFTGAGVSVRAGLPTWKRLVEQLAEGIRGSDPLITQLMYECVILIEHDAVQLSFLDTEVLKGEKSLFITADRKLQTVTAESKFSNVSEMMISHVGLIQFIELLLGGMDDGAGLTELLWSAQVSDRAQAVRSHFTSLALQQYDEGMAMELPSIIEEFTDAATQELDRAGADLDVEEPKKRANAFRVLGSLEKNYLAGMHEAVEKRRAMVDGNATGKHQ